MMYCEFIEGTGCKDNPHNYEVYKNLEVMYMNTDMSKAQVYEYGKKLVDNSKSPETLKLEAEIKAEIEELRERIKSCESDIEYRKQMVVLWEADGDKEMARTNKGIIKYDRDEIKAAKARIAACKWVLAG